MATKVVYTLREDKQGLQKQLGCMNGIFQLFDRRYLLGLHRHGRNQNTITSGRGEINGEKEFKNSSEKAKEKSPKKNTMIEKNRASVESSRNSFSSSCSSTTFSSFDCSKRVQTELQLPSEPTSPNLYKKQPDWSLPPPDFRDVVKESMTREIRVTKKERVDPVMKHVDSPRPFIHQKSVQYDRKDRNLAKVQKTSSVVKEVKEISRLSCDERESQYSLKSTFKVKELPRLSLDSKQISNRNSMNESRREPGSNKRPSSGVVARLMGLDSLTDSICEVETLKIKPDFSDQFVSNSPGVHSKIKPSLQKQQGGDWTSRKPSVYGEMEKRLSALEFNTSGKDLRALKQILEAMQMTKTGLENKGQSLNSQKSDQPVSPKVKGTSSPKRPELVNRTVKPAKMATEHINHMARKQVNDQTGKNMKATGRTLGSLSTLNTPLSSPRLQKSKNGVDKQCFHGPSSDSSRIKKQSNLKTKHPKLKPINPIENNEQSCRYTNDGDSISFKPKINTNLDSQSKLEVTRNDLPKETHRVSENYFAERLIEDKPMVELAKLSVEQPSPISVLDAFYIEDTPSPVKNKLNAFNDYENLYSDERESNQVDIYKLVNRTDTNLYSEFNHIKLENRNQIVHQIELLNSINETLESPFKSTNGDHRYITEILLASGFLNDPDSAIRIVQVHPTGSLMKPELFHHLENPNDESDKKNPKFMSNEKIRRKMIFDSVNEILFHKLVVWNGKRCGRHMNREKLLNELWSEIDNLLNCSKDCLYDEDDDEVKNLVSADVNKNSQDWDKCCYEVPGVVLDIERLIFKDLIDEVVNAEVASLQDRPRRRCRRLFSM